MRRILILIVVLLCCEPAFADEEKKVVELKPIVVTPSRFESGVESVTSAFSVVEDKEIENTVGDSLVDVLRKEEGISIKEYYGSGIRATADIRGFGETAPMNTLVLVDGRRINSVDLSVSY